MRVFLLSLCLMLSALSLPAGVWADVSRTASLDAQADEQTLVILGDSLSAGYGIQPHESWVALLQTRFKSKGLNVQLINASISGETSKGGLTRSTALLNKTKPDVLVLELGANDGLRGYSIKEMRANLKRIVDYAHDVGARVLLVGNHIPPNYGPLYTQQFFQSYRVISEAKGTSLVPFMLEGVATNPRLMQDDGLHPNAQAQAKILDNIWPSLYEMMVVP